jgi:hypothetical protein
MIEKTIQPRWQASQLPPYAAIFGFIIFTLLVASNILNLRTLDPVTIPRTWGPESKGLAIDLFLDKDNYFWGEDIALRMAVKNFSADANIASGECSAGFTFVVRDSNGQEIGTADSWPCSGHG